MNKKFKIASALLASGLIISPITELISQNDNVVNAKQVNKNNVFEHNIDLSKINVEEKLKEAEILLENKQITQEEFNIIKMILIPENSINQNYSFRSNYYTGYTENNYYPEQKIAYINHWGVREIYDKGLPTSRGLASATAFLLGLTNGPFGWGIGALGFIQAFGKNEYERAVHQAYWQGKGIDVYYQIHKGVMSLNKIRYVVI